MGKEAGLITALQISNLRGIADGHLKEIAPFSLLVGPNSSGKSTVLDALLIGAGNQPADGIGRAIRRRSHSWNGARWLFARHQEEPAAYITVQRHRAGVDEERATRLSLEVEPTQDLASALADRSLPLPFSAIAAEINCGQKWSNALVGVAANNAYLTRPLLGEPVRGWELRLIDVAHGTNPPLDEVYTQAVEKGRKDQAVQALRAVLGQRVKDITLLTDNRVPVVHIVYEDGSVPVSLAGDGAASLCRTALDLGGRPGGIVLLEEPETHQHPRILWQTAMILWATLSRGIQVILSTHSLDLIDAILATAPPDQLSQLRIFRCKLDRGELITTGIEGAEAAMMRSDFADDLR